MYEFVKEFQNLNQIKCVLSRNKKAIWNQMALV